MTDTAYVMARIEEGARVRIRMDYFGQHIVVVPRRWIPGERHISVTSGEATEIVRALRRRRRNNAQAA